MGDIRPGMSEAEVVRAGGRVTTSGDVVRSDNSTIWTTLGDLKMVNGTVAPVKPSGQQS